MEDIMIYIANDHSAIALKNEIIDFLKSENYEYTNLGTDDTNSCDYPDYAKLVAKKVLEDKGSKGILICGTGIGISIAANRFEGIRCALCHDVFSANATRLHNDANILALGARIIGAGHATMIVKEFLETEFSNDERHIKRINKIEGAVK